MLAIVGAVVTQAAVGFFRVRRFINLSLPVYAVLVIFVVFALIGAPCFLVAFVVGFVSHTGQLKQAYQISQIFSHVEIYMKGGGGEKAAGGGWRPSGILTIPLHLPWLRHHGSGIPMHDAGHRIRWGGLALMGPRSLHPDSLIGLAPALLLPPET